MHTSRITLDELAKAVQAAKASRGMNVHDGPALDGIRRELGIGGMQPAESARPPLASRVDVRTGGKQHVDHRATPRAGQGGRIEGADRLIDSGPQLGMAVEQMAGATGVVGLARLPELVCAGTIW
jgi:hypothetical protein